MANSLFLRVDEEAAARQFYLVSSVIDATSPNGITKPELVSLARQAWLTMKDNWNTWVKPYEKVSKGAPTVMTVMYDRRGNKLYFSSSVKRKPGASWLNLFRADEREIQLVVKALDECEMEDCANTRHPNKANCGEMLVIHQWAITNPGKGLHYLRDFWIVSVSRLDGVVYIKAPCNVDGLGCEKVTVHTELDVVAEPTTIPSELVTRPLAFGEARQVSITETAPCIKCGNSGYQPISSGPAGSTWHPCTSCFYGTAIAEGAASRFARETWNTGLQGS